MKIDNEFTVGVPVDRAWQVLTDLEGIAPCMPGAQLTGVDGDIYSGKVKIKVGPVISQYAGTAQIIEKDESEHRAVIRAKGKDSRGAGNASALINAELRADGASTVVTVVTDLNITGKIAQFGSGMIKEVSVKLLGQFVDNLEAELHASPDGGTTDTAAAADTGRTAPAVAGPVPGTGPAAPAEPGTAAGPTAGPGTPAGPVPPGTPAGPGTSGAPGTAESGPLAAAAGVTPSVPAPADSDLVNPDTAGAPGAAVGSTRPDGHPAGPERPEGSGNTTTDGTGGTPAQQSGAQAQDATAAHGGTGPVRGDTGAAGAGSAGTGSAGTGSAGAGTRGAGSAGAGAAASAGRPAATGGPTATGAASAPTADGAAPSDSPATAPSARPAVGARRAEPEPIDLMSLAGGSVYRRLIPLIAAALVVAALVVYFIVR